MKVKKFNEKVKMIVSLSKIEHDFLLNEEFLNPYLKRILNSIDSNYHLSISENDADFIRDECIEHWENATKLDKNINAKRKGIILQKLINKFFVS